MIYVVEVGYNRFFFDSIIEATTFATTAKEHYAKDKYGADGKNISVTIEIRKAEEED